MKKIVLLFGIVGLITLYSCSSTYKAGNNATDDIYYSTKDEQPYQAASSSNNSVAKDYTNSQNNSENFQNGNSNQNQQDDYAPSEENSTYTTSSDDKGNTYVTNNYNGDYYDYEYSSRIRRFYNPVYGFNYYDPYYTNSYLYDYNPSSWGVSIYLGYNWWAPSSYYYDPFCYGGFSVGYGYNPYWGYQPYSYCGPYYNNYYNGYNQGYWHGYNDGYYGGNSNPCYYNSYDATSFYYGPRGTVSNNSPQFSSQRQSNIAPISTKYEQAISDGKISGRSKSDISNLGRQNSSTEKNVQQIFRDKNSGDLSGTEENKKENRNNSISKPSINQEVNPATKNQNQNINNSSRNNTGENKSSLEVNPKNENSKSETKDISDQKANGGKNSNGLINKNTNPSVTPNRDRSDFNSQDRSDNQKENLKLKKESQSPARDNVKTEQTSKQGEQVRRKKESRVDMPSRQENKTPVFTPRVEPRQFKQETVPSQQRTQPSRSAEPNNNKSGGRKK